MLAPAVWDEFSRDVASGAGTSGSGHTWSGDTVSTSVVNAGSGLPGRLVHDLSSATTVICAVGPDIRDTQVRALVRPSALSAGAALSAGLVARYTDDDNHVYATVTFAADQSVGWEIHTVAEGTDTTVDSGTTAIEQVADGAYWMAFEADRTHLRVSVWSDATGQPLEWTGQTTSATVVSAGAIGVRSAKATGNTTTTPSMAYSHLTRTPYADVADAALPWELECAFGADRTADAATWSWTAVTSDVILPQADAPGVTITQGTRDWADRPTPATLKAMLDNTSGDYTPDAPASSLWPDVVRGVPCRVRVLYSHIRFFGYVDGWPQTYGTVTDDSVRVPLSASGVLRRMGQGEQPQISAVERYLSTLSASARPTDYWPLDDQPGTTVPRAIYGARMRLGGTPGWADASTLYAGDAVDLSGGGTLSAPVSIPASAAVQAAAVMVMLRLPDTAPDDPIRLIRLGGTEGAHIDISVGSDAVSAAMTTDDGAASAVAGSTAPAVWDGDWHLWTVILDLSATTAQLAVATDDMTTSTTWLDTGLVQDSARMGDLQRVIIWPSGEADVSAPAVSTLAVWAPVPVSDIDDVSTWAPATATAVWAAARGHDGDSPVDRLVRLCDQEGLPLDVAGDSRTTMGPQPMADVGTILTACQQADLGVLRDGHGAGLSYASRATRYDRTVSLRLLASAGQIPPGLTGMHDDQTLRNRWRVYRSGGSASTVSLDDADDPLSTTRVGVYADSTTINVDSDEQALWHAGWRVHAGTVPGLRWPGIVMDLRRSPELGQGWLSTPLAGVIALDELPTPAPDDEVLLAVQGWREALGDHHWTATLNATPADVWQVLVLDDPDLGRLDSDTSTLAAAAATTDATISVATSGVAWTTAAAAYPMDLSLDGVHVRVSDVDGGTSPQTMTLMPRGRMLAVEHFASTQTSGWPDPWVVDAGTASDYKVSSAGSAQIVGGEQDGLYIIVLPVGAADQEIRTTVSLDQLVTGTEVVSVEVHARFADDGNQYRFVLSFGPDGNADARIYKDVSNDITLIAHTDDAVAYTADSVVHLVGRVEGSALSLRTWADGDSEPDDWTVTVTDTDLTGAADIAAAMFVGEITNTLPITATFGSIAVTVPDDGDRLPLARASGTAVHLWRPGVIAL